VSNRWVTSFATRGLMLSFVWLLLSGSGGAGALLTGVGVVAAATVASLRIAPPTPGRRLHLRGTARFVPYFVWHSLRGGADVALRALHPRLPLEPRLETFAMGLEGSSARTFFVNVVSLLPGTLSVDVTGGDRLLVHVIGGGGAAEERLRTLERRVGDIFGERPKERSQAGNHA